MSVRCRKNNLDQQETACTQWKMPKNHQSPRNVPPRAPRVTHAPPCTKKETSRALTRPHAPLSTINTASACLTRATMSTVRSSYAPATLAMFGIHAPSCCQSSTDSLLVDPVSELGDWIAGSIWFGPIDRILTGSIIKLPKYQFSHQRISNSQNTAKKFSVIFWNCPRYVKNSKNQLVISR